MKRFFRKKRKTPPDSPQQPISAGEPTNVAARPPGSQAAQDVIPEDDGRRALGPRIIYQDAVPEVCGTRRRGEPPNEGTGNTGARESELVVELNVTKGAHMGTSLGGTAFHVDGTTHAAQRFGPLKSILGAIHEVYANDEGTVAIGNRIESLLSRVIALERSFDSRPSDVPERTSGKVSAAKRL